MSAVVQLVDPPPSCLRDEAEVLGAVLYKPARVAVFAALLPEHFFASRHTLIFRAILAEDAAGEGGGIDRVAVRLGADGRLEQVGGRAYLQQLVDSVPVRQVAELETCAANIMRAATRRATIDALRVALARAEQSDTPPEQIKRALFDKLDEHAAATAGPRAIPTIGAGDIFAPLPPFPWLIPGLQVGPGRPTLLVGYANVGKTVIAQTVGVAVASGRPVWGIYAPNRARVLHLDGEIGNWLARSRYQRIARAMGVDVAALQESDSLRLASYPDLRLDDADAEKRLVAAAQGFGLVIIDSLRAFAGALNENDREIGGALLMLARVSEATGATMIVLHHTRKPQKDQVGGARMAISGSGSIPGGSESIFIMSGEKGEPARVVHDRTPFGSTLDDFALRIEDVEIDGDPRGGLRVVHLQNEQVEAEQTAAAVSRNVAKFSKLKSDIVAAVRQSSDALTSANAICERVTGGNKTSKLQALKELLAEGQLVQPGGEKSPIRGV